MDRDEEKDLYIKAKLKDGHIPEKIDNLFNNSAKLIEDVEPPKKNKNQIILKRVAGIAACAVIVLGGGNIYATTQGYDNIFFMIKEWVAPSGDANGKDAILSDRDITISYKSIEIAKGIKMQINRLVVKDNEAKLYLKIDQAETELDITPFTYVVRDEKGNEICNYTSTNKEMIYAEELKLEGLKKNAKKLELEVKQNNKETLVKFDIDLENKEIQVIGNEQELQKISEEELKKYLGAFALLNYEDDTLNSGVTDKEILETTRELMVARQIAKINNQPENTDVEVDVEGLCIDVTDIMYSNGIYTVTFTYCYPTTKDIDENRIEDLPVYEMTIGLTINEDQSYSKYSVSSKMESKLVKAGKETTEIDVTAKCKEALEKYLRNSLNGGATGISFEIVTMELKESTDTSYTYEVEYKEEPYEGQNQKMYVTLEYSNGNYVVSEIEYLSNDATDIVTPSIDEDLKKFIGEWELDYIIAPTGQYGYEYSISNVRGSNKRVTLTIKEDGTFVEFIQDTEAIMGKYIKINENTIKRTYDEDGIVIYTTYEENKLGETVISNICRMDQSKYEYYVKETNIIKESLVGNWWRSYNVDHEEEYELNLHIQSDGTFTESSLQEADESGIRQAKITGRGTYKITQNGNWDVVELRYENGEVHILLYGQKGTSKDNQTKLHYSAGQQVFEKFVAVEVMQ